MKSLCHLVLGDVDIGMHAEDAGVCDVRQTANIVEIRVVLAVRRRVVDLTLLIKVVFLIGDDFRAVELGEDRPERSTVPVVGDSTTVVALARQVLERVELHLQVLPYNTGIGIVTQVQQYIHTVKQTYKARRVVTY